MWSTQERWCTICAFAVIAAFVGLALYLDPIGLSRLNPFSDDECNAQQIKNNIDRYQQYSTNSFAGGEGIASLPNPNSREPSEQQHGEEWTKADYYACRLAIYTRQLVIVTTILAVATVVLIVTAIYQGRHLDRAANAAKESADALPTLERAYIFLQINPNVADWIRGIVESELFFRDKVVVRSGSGVSRVPIVDHYLINHGKTPAIIHAMSANFIYSPALVITNYEDDAMSGDIVLAAGGIFPPASGGRHALITFSGPVTDYHSISRLTETNASSQKTDLEIDGTLAEELKNGRSFLWFHGHVVYEDIFGKNRGTSFCWRYDGRDGTFQQYGKAQNRRT